MNGVFFTMKDPSFLTKFGFSPIEGALLIAFASIFVWFYREIKNQLIKQEDDKKIKIDKTFVALTKILSLGYKYFSIS